MKKIKYLSLLIVFVFVFSNFAYANSGTYAENKSEINVRQLQSYGLTNEQISNLGHRALIISNFINDGMSKDEVNKAVNAFLSKPAFDETQAHKVLEYKNGMAYLDDGTSVVIDDKPKTANLESNKDLSFTATSLSDSGTGCKWRIVSKT